MIGGRLAGQAIVIGAGIAGLAAARALADRFARVLVVERDALPEKPEDRAGTPQSRHGHGLLVSGQRALAKLFPGIEREFSEAGGVLLRGGLDVRVDRPGYDPFPRRDLGLHSYSMSRPGFEAVLRRRVRMDPRIELRDRCRVDELRAAADGTAVTGLTLVDPQGRREMLAADLVVDASGRGKPTLDLLRSIGMAAPEETVIGVDLGYATCLFEMPQELPDWKGLMVFGQVPQNARGALLLPIEGNRWMVTLGGRGEQAPTGDAAGFLAFAAQLRTHTLHDALRHARLASEPSRYRFRASVWRHFERLTAFPRGLLPIGDAICRFNPVYGQGMSVAALEACLLRRLLERDAGTGDPLANLAQRFFAKVPSLLETPWRVASLDFLFPGTRGVPPPDLPGMLKFGQALTRLAAEDPSVHRLTAEVQHLITPGSAYREPALLQRVMKTISELEAAA